jgi:hypothetical protein
MHDDNPHNQHVEDQISVIPTYLKRVTTDPGVYTMLIGTFLK